MIEHVIERLGAARVLRLSPIDGKTFLLRVAIGGEEVEFTARGLELLSETRLPPHPRRVERRRLVRSEGRGGFVSAFHDRPHWPEELLRREGLPLYWNEAWLRAELERLGSYVEIERAWGYPNSTVAAFAKREFGIEVKPRKGSVKALVRRVWRENPGITLAELARRTGVSKATAYRYVRGAGAGRRGEGEDD